MRISDWSSDVCSSDLKAGLLAYLIHRVNESKPSSDMTFNEMMDRNQRRIKSYRVISELVEQVDTFELVQLLLQADSFGNLHRFTAPQWAGKVERPETLFHRSEEHTSELQSLMRISYAVCCLKKKNYTTQST